VEFEPTSSEDPLLRPTGAPLQGGSGLGPRSREPLPEEGRTIADSGSSDAAALPVPFRQTLMGRVVYTGLPVLGILLAVALAYRFQVIQRMPRLISRVLDTGGGGAVPVWVRAWEQWTRLESVERAFATISLTLRFLGRPQPMQATAAAQAAALRRILPSAGSQIDALREELESGLFTPRPANVGRAWRAGLIVLLHGLRARVDRTLAALDGRPTYSDGDH